MAEMDRRVRRTRRLLRDALVELIQKQGYDSITIQNIVDRADLSRATFYLHYKDKDELLASSLEEMFDELLSSLSEPLFRSQDIATEQEPSVVAFRHVQEYSSLYKALLLGDRGVSYVIHRELQYIARISEKQIAWLLPRDTQPLVPIEILARHIAGALFGLILWWLENDMPRSPEEMGLFFRQMAMGGLTATLNLNGPAPSVS